MRQGGAGTINVHFKQVPEEILLQVDFEKHSSENSIESCV